MELTTPFRRRTRARAPCADADADVRCEACGSGDAAGELLLCDGCDRGLHFFCLRPILPRVPAGCWFCPSCSSSSAKPSSPSPNPKQFPLIQTKIVDIFKIQRGAVAGEKLGCRKRKRKRKAGGALVVAKRKRKLLPFNPSEDPARRLQQMASLATALTATGAAFSNELTYMPGMAPRAANRAALEAGGMQSKTFGWTSYSLISGVHARAAGDLSYSRGLARVPPVYANGHLHWLVGPSATSFTPEEAVAVLSFSGNDENFATVKSPPLLAAREELQERVIYDSHLDVPTQLRGHLCMVRDYRYFGSNRRTVDVCALRDKSGGDGGWSLDHSIDVTPYRSCMSPVFAPLVVTVLGWSESDERILIGTSGHKVFAYYRRPELWTWCSRCRTPPSGRRRKPSPVFAFAASRKAWCPSRFKISARSLLSRIVYTIPKTKPEKSIIQSGGSTIKISTNLLLYI